MKPILWILAALVAGALWVRVAPTPQARWHIDPATAKAPRATGYRTETLLALPAPDALIILDKKALETARTKAFAGSVAEGRITYVTRSRIWGFPDYTTVSANPQGEQTQLVLLGRLRFGIGDGGVNRARIRRWLKALEAIDQ